MSTPPSLQFSNKEPFLTYTSNVNSWRDHTLAEILISHISSPLTGIKHCDIHAPFSLPAGRSCADQLTHTHILWKPQRLICSYGASSCQNAYFAWHGSDRSVKKYMWRTGQSFLILDWPLCFYGSRSCEKRSQKANQQGRRQSQGP